MASDTSISRWRRVGYAALSGISGWLVGQIACLPVNVIVAVRDTEGQPKLFVETLFYGLLAWGALDADSGAAQRGSWWCCRW